jgi:energy-converting hydrogenase Eha subunit B
MDIEQLVTLYSVLLNASICLNNMIITVVTLIKYNRARRSRLLSELAFGPAKKVKRLSKPRKYWVRPGRTDLWFKNFMEDK